MKLWNGILVLATVKPSAAWRMTPWVSQARSPNPIALVKSQIVPPAPTDGDPRDANDRKVFQSTRSLKDSPRWSLATADADEAAIVKDMSCAIGMELTPQTAPKLTKILMTARYDVRRAVTRWGGTDADDADDASLEKQ